MRRQKPLGLHPHLRHRRIHSHPQNMRTPPPTYKTPPNLSRLFPRRPIVMARLDRAIHALPSMQLPPKVTTDRSTSRNPYDG
jgi:hypothetical protein